MVPSKNDGRGAGLAMICGWPVAFLLEAVNRALKTALSDGVMFSACFHALLRSNQKKAWMPSSANKPSSHR
jgi:hypothetical protein